MDLEVNSRIRVLVDEVQQTMNSEMLKVQEQLESVAGSVKSQMGLIHDRLASNDQKDAERDVAFSEEINEVREYVETAVSKGASPARKTAALSTSRASFPAGIQPEHHPPPSPAAVCDTDAKLRMSTSGSIPKMSTHSVNAAAIEEIRLAALEEKFAALEQKLEMAVPSSISTTTMATSPVAHLNQGGGGGSDKAVAREPRRLVTDEEPVEQVRHQPNAANPDINLQRSSTVDSEELSAQAAEELRSLECRVSDLEHTLSRSPVASPPSRQDACVSPVSQDLGKASESLGGRGRSRGIEELMNRVCALEATIYPNSPMSPQRRNSGGGLSVDTEDIKLWVQEELNSLRSMVNNLDAQKTNKMQVVDTQFSEDPQSRRALAEQSKAGLESKVDDLRAQAISPASQACASEITDRVRSPDDFGPLSTDGHTGEFVHQLSIRVQRMDSRLSHLESVRETAPDNDNGSPTSKASVAVEKTSKKQVAAQGESSSRTDVPESDELATRPPRGQDPLDWLQKRIDRVIEQEDQEKIISGEHMEAAAKKQSKVEMQARLNLIESRMEEVAKKMDGMEHQRESIGRPLVAEEMQRLRCCFEYLMRMVPPDVNRALTFFKKTENPENTETSVIESLHTGDDQLDLKLGLHFDTMRTDINSTAKELKREVHNVYTAVRGMQRDAEVSNMKLEDICSRHEALKSRVEFALPQILSVLQELRKEKSRLSTPATADGKSRSQGKLNGKDLDKTQQLANTSEGTLKRSSGTPTLGGKKSLPGELEKLLTGVDERLSTPHPFVSQGALKSTLEVLQADITRWLAQLRDDVLDMLNGKADSEQLQSIVLKMQQEQSHFLQIHQAANSAFQGNKTAAYSAIETRQLVGVGRCMSCDAALDSTTRPGHGTQSTVSMTQTSKPNHKAWPARAPLMEGGTGPVKSQPRTLKKDLSLPSITNP